MMTLFTGQPGNGKTAALVDFLRTHVGDRPLYVDGLNGLKIPHEPLDVSEWHRVVPDGAIVVVDEVQRRWRPAGPGQRVPDDIQALETHRHRGIDFYIVTQSPKLVHSNVRELVGRHVHIRDIGVLGRWWYEWPECSIAIAWKSAPIKKRYRLPRAAFDLYKSSSMHIKPVRSFPWMLVVFCLALAAIGVLSWWIWHRVQVHNNAPAAVPAGAGSSIVGTTTGPGLKVAGEPITSKSLRAGFVPRIAAQPNSAPAYDGLRRVVSMPRIQGGYCQRGECRCYIQGGLRAPIDAKACYEWLKNPPFDPYYIAPTASQSASASAT